MKRQNIEYIAVSELKLWSENPRDPITTEWSDFDIISKAIRDDKKKWNLKDFTVKMGLHYDLSELPTVVVEKGKNIVYDGNRRVALLKYLQDKELYAKLGGGLFPNEEPIDLINLTEIPCNVCDKETALINIERKHINNGSWATLERDYFLYLHRNKDKSLFIQLDKQTEIISNNKKMNQGFVKTEILTAKNLEDIGFNLDSDNGIKSNYSKKETDILLNNIVELVENGIVRTRGNFRGKLKEPLIHNKPELTNILRKFNASKPSSRVSKEKQKTPLEQPRKTPVSKPKEIIFGRTLELEDGLINNTYRAIDAIFKFGKDDNSILSIVGMSLRFLLDVAAKEYYTKHNTVKSNSDSLYGDFIKVAKKEMILSPKQINYLSLTNDWLDSKNSLDGALAKYAHGSMIVTKDGILERSYIVGDIVEYYFKKKIK